MRRTWKITKPSKEFLENWSDTTKY